MNCEIVEEGYEPRPGRMDTRRLWIAHPDYIDAYSEVSYRIAHSALVLSERERYLLRWTVGLDRDGYQEQEGDTEAIASLVERGVLTKEGRPDQWLLSPHGPVSQEVLLTLLDME